MGPLAPFPIPVYHFQYTPKNMPALFPCTNKVLISIKVIAGNSFGK